MLAYNRLEKYLKYVKYSVALLLFISIITFHIDVLAASKEKIARDYRSKGIAEQKNGNFIEALTNYSKAISLGEIDAVLYNDMGILYEQVGKLQFAEESYQRAVQLDPNYLPVFSNLAYFYLNTGNKNLAARYFKHRIEKADLYDPWAIKAKEELIKIKPGYEHWFNKVEDHKLKLLADDLSQEITHNIQKEFEMQISKSNQIFEKGLRYTYSRQYEKAISEFDRALSITPKNSKILEAKQRTLEDIAKRDFHKYSDRAMEMFDSGDRRSARREIQRMLTTLPSD